jgi:hypothetical protein
MSKYLPIIVLIKLAELAQIILAPIVVPIAVKWFGAKYSGRLPRGFRWMETPDCLLPGGLYEPQVKEIYERHGWTACAIYWLIRNRAYRLSRRWAYWPRIVIEGGVARVYQGYVEGDIRTGDDEGDREGTVRFFAGDYWEFYKVRRLFGNFGYRLRFGWKLAPFFRTDFAQWPNDPENSAWGMPVAHVSLRRIKSERLK